MSEPKLDITVEEVEIIDFQSEDRSASRENTEVKPIPKNVKYIMGGIALLMVFGMTGLYAYSKKSSVDEIPTVSIDEYEIETIVGTDELIASLDKSPLSASESDIKKRLTLAPVTEQEKLNERMISMEVQIQQMTQQMESLTKQGEVVSQLNTQVSQLSKTVKEVVTQDDLSVVQQNFSESMQQFRSEIRKAVEKKYKKKKFVKRKRSTRAKNIPFKLVSIDQWDGVHYAAIQSKNVGAIENLRVGDRRSGWKVEKIDVIESLVMFKNIKTGQSVKQTVI